MSTLDAQNGQALAEALVTLGVLASLCLGVAWLGRTQDVALQLSHASRQAAFAWAHQGLRPSDPSGRAVADSLALGLRARTRQGADLLSGDVQTRLDALPVWQGRRPGDPASGAGEIRAAWRLGDDALWRASVSARTAGQDRTTGGLRDFDAQALALQRHTVIMRGSGAAADDAAVQATLGASGQAWDRAAQASRALGRQVDHRLQGVDAAWGRERPDWDWLGPWQGWVPARHLTPRSQP